MTYPNGTVLTYSYGTTGSLNDTISRLDSLVEGSQTIESYQYLGLSTVVVREQPQAGMELTYLQQSGDSSTNTDGGDQYTGLNRFGRVIDQNWISTSDGSTLDRYQYAYDRDGNVVAKNNLLDSGLNETYTYDDLGRLTDMTRGGSDYQSWNLDAVGNMDSVTTGGTTTDNTTNAQNELTGLGNATLAYDNDGNTTTDNQGHTLVYDAWNRLISVSSGGTTIASYSYDGTGRQLIQTTSAGTTDLYYSSQWQVIEERQGGNTTAQEIWSPGKHATIYAQPHYSAFGNVLYWEILFKNEDAAVHDCADNPWKRIRHAIDMGSIIDVHLSGTSHSGGPIVDGSTYPGGLVSRLPDVHVNFTELTAHPFTIDGQPGTPNQVQTISPVTGKPGGAFNNVQDPFPVVLYHELIGHALMYVDARLAMMRCMMTAFHTIL